MKPASQIRAARMRAGLTQAELAQRSRARQSAFSAYETGRREASVTTLTRLAETAGFALEVCLVPIEDQRASQRLLEHSQRFT